jgi:predicted dienelactone hydrolase
MRISLLAAAALLTLPGIVHAQEDTIALGGRQVVTWRPTQTAGVRAPVVIFSHGLGGCPTQSRFMTAGLAARGYWVFAPVHRDAGCLPKRASSVRPKHPLSQPQMWTDLTYANRIDDVRAIVAALSAPQWSKRVDVAQLAVAGHSLGGYTALSLAGGWTLMRMPGVRAVLTFAPYTTPFGVHGGMSEISLPVMFQSGALDASITAPIARRGGAYDEARGPNYFVAFARAKHSSWGNAPNAAHDAMLAYAAAFLDRYVRGRAVDSVLTTKRPGVSDLRFSRGDEPLTALDPPRE